MAVSSEHCRIMEDAGGLADRAWVERGRFIAGDAGYESMEHLSVKNSHPALPIFLTHLGMLPAMSNGATIELWGSNDPLCMVVLNVNHSQSRKSRLCGMAEGSAAVVDAACAAPMLHIWAEKLRASAAAAAAKRRRLEHDAPAPEMMEDTDGLGVAGASQAQPVGGLIGGVGLEERQREEKDSPFPGTVSIAFLGGTIERVRERCAGDFSMVRQTRASMRLPGLREEVAKHDMPNLTAPEVDMAMKPGMQGRCWFGQALVYDEIYQFLQDLAILDQPQAKRAVDMVGAGQTPLAGWFNRLVQTGKSDHETKTCGSHGGLGAPMVSVSILGNLHPTPAIELVQGLRGDHGCQAKARLFFVTGTPIQPHEHVKTGGSVKCETIWVEVPQEIRRFVGLAEVGNTVHDFNAFFESLDLGDDGQADVGDVGQVGEDEDPYADLAPFIPHEDGHEHVLPDGVVTWVRLALLEGAYRLQWSLPDRNITIPADRDIMQFFPDFVKLCHKHPHKPIGLTSAARGAFLSFSTMYQVRVKQARDDRDADQGAEWGIGPWKLGQISGCLLLWDLVWKKWTPRYKEEEWKVDLHHVQRAHALMDMLDSTREALRKGRFPPPADDVEQKVEDEVGGEERNLPGVPEIVGVAHTVIARRLLIKATPTGNPNERAITSHRVFTIFAPKERKDWGKFNVAVFRAIARACPNKLGTYDEDRDRLVFVVPPEDDDAVNIAVRSFANTNIDWVRRATQVMECKKKTGGNRRASQ